LVFDHGVEDAEQLAHARYQRDFLELASVAQPLVQRTQHRIVFGDAERRHVQNLTHGSASSSDVSLAAIRAAVVIEGGDPDQRCDLLAVELAQLGHHRRHRLGRHMADAGISFLLSLVAANLPIGSACREFLRVSVEQSLFLTVNRE
jgi:hypothetical protein